MDNDLGVPHRKYWLDDGSLVVKLGNDLFKVHRSVLVRQSPSFYPSLRRLTTNDEPPPSDGRGIEKSKTFDTETSNDAERVLIDNTPVFSVNPQMTITTRDFEALLTYLYRDIPLNASANDSFHDVYHLLRASSPQTCNFPEAYAWAVQLWSDMFAAHPLTTEFGTWKNLHDALAISSDLRLKTVEKALFYAIVVSPDIHLEVPSSAETPSDAQIPHSSDLIASSHTQLSRRDYQRCSQLMHIIINHFTPMLFQPQTAGHMQCTDVLADRWMPLVVQPALANDGVYKPLETLRSMANIDWANEGLCESCISEKRKEWKEDAIDIWDRMDEWIELIDRNE
ncbi:hypothetical protein BD410DRAFT_789578 [Rickenella mellea]|uniref:BTB domain-containing protein n=1 Tax=Rickenella mellea TaxID=50990 RepID=A0A4Y7Q2V3_9AGAM|nr:hypothetical protein BD410DRAFT_789578 [Rickenella mellea]